MIADWEAKGFRKVSPRPPKTGREDWKTSGWSLRSCAVYQSVEALAIVFQHSVIAIAWGSGLPRRKVGRNCPDTTEKQLRMSRLSRSALSVDLMGACKGQAGGRTMLGTDTQRPGDKGSLWRLRAPRCELSIRWLHCRSTADLAPHTLPYLRAKPFGHILLEESNPRLKASNSALR